jgi:hypothetical protein
VGNALIGIETWNCEFTVVHSGPEQYAYAGSQACWSDHGGRERLRLPTD